MFPFVVAMALLAGVSAQAAAPSPNLISNGDFEAPADANVAPPGFRITPFDSHVAARGEFSITDDAHSGEQALRVTRTNTDTGYAVVLPAPEFAAPDQPRRRLLTAWVKVLGTRGRDRDAPIRVQAFTPQWTGACRTLHETLPHRYFDGWSRYAVLMEQQPSLALVHIRFPIEAARSGDGVILDDIALYDVDGWPESDLKALPAPAREPGEHAVNAMPFRAGNLLTTSSFELGLRGGWSIPKLLPEQQRACVVEGEARHGGRMMRLEIPSTKHMVLTGRFIPVRPNQTHSLSVWAKTDSDGVKLTARFESGYVPDDGSPHAHSQEELLAPRQWRRVVTTGVTEAGPENAYAARVTAAGPEGAVVLLDAVQFEEGPVRDFAPAQPVEAALWPRDVIGICEWAAPIAYDRCVFNSGAEAAAMPLQVVFTDFFGREVARHDVGETFAPGLTVTPMAHPAPARGALRARLMRGEELADEVTFTVVPPVRHPERYAASRFGQHVRLEPWQMTVAKRLGAGWTRLHDASKACSWDYVEPEPGKWVWADDEIEAAHGAGLEVLGVFGRCPVWAAEPDAFGNRPNAGGWHYPEDLDAWARYVEETARHFRGQVDVWEIWNEPYGFGVGDGAKYAALAKAAHAAAKRGNPDCTVLGFCTWEGATDFNRDALAGGTMDACDCELSPVHARRL